MKYRKLSLVSGYHPSTYPPAEAFDGRLRERFSVVLASFRPDRDGMFFDATVFLRMTEAIVTVIPHTSVSIQMPGGIRFASLRDLAQNYARVSKEDRDPPLRMR